MSSIDLSIVLPAYEAADEVKLNVPLLQNYLQQQGISFEIVVVDDGSVLSPISSELSRTLQLVSVRLPKNRGKGAAIREGVKRASGEIILYTDCDIPFALEDMMNAVNMLKNTRAAMVAGDRTLKDSSYFVRVGFIRNLASGVCSFIVGHFVAGGWFDTQCGLKAFRREVAKELFGLSRINRFAFDVEIFYLALKRKFLVHRLPVHLRRNETSSVKIVRDSVWFIGDLFRIILYQKSGAYARALRELSVSRGEGDLIPIPGDYQYRVSVMGPRPQQFWHQVRWQKCLELGDMHSARRVLDIGCGSGVFSSLIAGESEAQVVAIDANPEAIEFARKKFEHSRIEFKLSTFGDFSGQPGSFDRIVLLEVVEHLPEEMVALLFQRARQLLTPDGYLVISTPNRKSLWPAIEWLLDHLPFSPVMSEAQHVKVYDAVSLSSALESAGFQVLEVESIFVMSPWITWLSTRLAKAVFRIEKKLLPRNGSLLLVKAKLKDGYNKNGAEPL